MHELFLELFSDIDEFGRCLAPLETLVTLFTYTYCDHPTLALTFVITSDDRHRTGFEMKVPKLLFEVIEEGDVEGVASKCRLPVLLSEDQMAAVAGLCGVLRGVMKLVDPQHPLLGFKQSCLYACAESSVWTRFCEVDMIRTVNELYEKKEWTCERVEIPYDVARFEAHMSQPVRIHNIQKEKQEVALSKGGHRRRGLADSRQAPVQELEHKYSEGHRMTLADVMLLPSFHVIFERLGSVFLKQHLPLSCKWYENMLKDEKIRNGLKIFLEVGRKFDKEIYVNYWKPDVGNVSLYKGEMKKKEKGHFHTRQEDIIECLERVSEIGDFVQMRENTFGREIDFDWRTVPNDGTQIPANRMERKGQQLQNMTKAVLKIARNGDEIVDFCSGSGHLGLILAHALPRCSLVLLENKEQSLNRARERARQLNLSNVFFCQSNVDYFKGRFSIGVSLHACGVATDLVMERCLQQCAAFVCCPCCYGSIGTNHVVWYPRSEVFRKSSLGLKQYFVLAHAADQTHYEDNAKTSQGNRCMAVIDWDRCLRAKEAGYAVVLSKLDPPSCTPKNNLLVGVPQGMRKRMAE